MSESLRRMLMALVTPTFVLGLIGACAAGLRRCWSHSDVLRKPAMKTILCAVDESPGAAEAVAVETERREAGARALNAQEEERQRIARGLHDEVGQTMTGVLLLLKRLAQDAMQEQHTALGEAQAAVKASLEDVRRTAQELRPEILDHLGLPSALTNLARTYSDRTGIPVRRQLATQLPRLDPSAELVVYRVAQEGLTNAARHSGASEVTLTLEHDADSVVLRVLDDGRGFEGNHAEGGGLRGIRERALIVGAAVAIKPAPSGGVEIRLQVPVAAES